MNGGEAGGLNELLLDALGGRKRKGKWGGGWVGRWVGGWATYHEFEAGVPAANALNHAGNGTARDLVGEWVGGWVGW